MGNAGGGTVFGSGGYQLVVTDESATVFVDEPSRGEIHLTMPKMAGVVRVVGVPPLARVSLRPEAGTIPPLERTANAGEVAVFTGTERWRRRLVLSWRWST